MINPRELIKKDVLSGNFGKGSKSLSHGGPVKGVQDINRSLKNIFQEGETMELTQSRMIMENKIFGKFDFTQDLKKNFEGHGGKNNDIFEFIERKQSVKDRE
jgi:hypothetical protein